MSSCHEVTRLLREWANGNESALEALTPLVYAELRHLAESYLRREEHPGHTLQPTAVVHEAYLRLLGQTPPKWKNRTHFCGIAVRLMRQILVDHARRWHAGRRAGRKVPLEELVRLHHERSADLVTLTALGELKKNRPKEMPSHRTSLFCRTLEWRKRRKR